MGEKHSFKNNSFFESKTTSETDLFKTPSIISGGINLSHTVSAIEADRKTFDTKPILQTSLGNPIRDRICDIQFSGKSENLVSGESAKFSGGFRRSSGNDVLIFEIKDNRRV
ncbi:hypothetical protein AMTR_s00067p00139050 [Amborella trichopoda]|uniref:Uncharacterized protein n=1 Tax=Amborella trichopoda TaxID=13333 RepID=U5CZS0_AMBTC|nr:hypothetical protein AMTR_s00067p00139050 [Amborella trichopoda]